MTGRLRTWLLLIGFVALLLILSLSSSFVPSVSPSQHEEKNAVSLPTLSPLSQTDKVTKEEDDLEATRIGAVVQTHERNHATRIRAIMSTWGKHLDVLLVASDSGGNASDDGEGRIRAVVRKQEDQLGLKMLASLRTLCQEIHPINENRNATEATRLPLWRKYRYYLITDDDTFIVVPNLKRKLRELEHHGIGNASANHSVSLVKFDPTRQHLYTGYLLTHTKPAFIGGGGGIVLSQHTMRAVCGAIQAPARGGSKHYHHANPCKAPAPTTEYAGDTALLTCLHFLKVHPIHTEGFYPFPLDTMVREKDNYCKTMWWFPKTVIKCPPIARAISFHYVPVERFSEYYYWTYTFSSQMR